MPTINANNASNGPIMSHIIEQHSHTHLHIPQTTNRIMASIKIGIRNNMS